MSLQNMIALDMRGNYRGKTVNKKAFFNMDMGQIKRISEQANRSAEAALEIDPKEHTRNYADAMYYFGEKGRALRAKKEKMTKRAFWDGFEKQAISLKTIDSAMVKAQSRLAAAVRDPSTSKSLKDKLVRQYSTFAKGSDKKFSANLENTRRLKEQGLWEGI